MTSSCDPTTTGPRACQSFTPLEVAERYGFPLNKGSGQVVGIFAFGPKGTIGIDIETLKQQLKERWGTTRRPEFVVHVHAGQVNQPPQSGGELHLDATTLGYYLQNAARINIYIALWQDAPAAIAKAVDDGCTVTTCSFGTHDASLSDAIDQAIEDAVKSPILLCWASGDSGAACGWQDGGYPVDQIGYPSGHPKVVSVGGTFVPSDCDRQEIGWWNYPPAGSKARRSWWASGGGVSTRFAVPSYQSAIDPTSFPTKGQTHNGRGAPDVACMAQGNELGTGTSVASPTFASLIACLNAELAETGYNNPITANIFHQAIYDPPSGIQPFDHVAVASNVPPLGQHFPTQGYTAQPGWDACTGLGTPNGPELLALFQAVIGKA